MFKKISAVRKGLSAKRNTKKAVDLIPDAKTAIEEDIKEPSTLEVLTTPTVVKDPKSLKVKSLIVMYVSLALLSIKGITNAFGIDLPIPDIAIEHIAELIGTLVMSYLLYSHVASTDKIDLFGRSDDRDSGNEREDN